MLFFVFLLLPSLPFFSYFIIILRKKKKHETPSSFCCKRKIICSTLTQTNSLSLFKEIIKKHLSHKKGKSSFSNNVRQPIQEKKKPKSVFKRKKNLLLYNNKKWAVLTFVSLKLAISRTWTPSASPTPTSRSPSKTTP